ncbi:MAG: ABC transporter ATP-binding protein [Clostridiales bacterium]|nr:ABC transporter ATP-binding protein [Clostridiales bacterium]
MSSKTQQKNAPAMHPRAMTGRGPMPMFAEKPKNAKKTLKRLISYLGRNIKLVITLIVLVAITSIVTLLDPYFQANAIDAIANEGGIGVDFATLYKFLICMGVAFILRSAITFFTNYIAAVVSQVTVKSLRKDLFSCISKLPIKYIDNHRHGDIMSRMTNDVENISHAVSQSISSIFSAVISILGCIVFMMYYSPLLTGIIVLILPISMFISLKLGKLMRKYYSEQQRVLGELNSKIEETVSGYQTIVSYTKEDDCIESFNETSKRLRKIGIRAQIFGGVMGPTMNLISNISFLTVAAVGGSLALKGIMTIGAIQAFIQYSKQFTRPINELANQYTQLQTAIAAAERVFEMMDTPPEIDDGTIVLDADKVEGNISFENVVFSYKEGEPVLKGFNLNIKKGSKVAVVGATGEGKTTLVNLLTRFYEIDEGRITLDGVDIKDISKDSLRGIMAIVLQDTLLFSNSIKENIRFGRTDATDEEIIDAAKISNAHKFIKVLPEKYDTELNENATTISQGQRQLLSIARAVLADPKILILDEATSSVDTRTEMHIQQAMIQLMKNRTSIIIAHRLSTIRDADVIVVLSGGVVAEAGNHEELLAKKGCYYSLYQNQFSGIAT